MRVSICCPWSRAATGLVTEQKWQSAAVTRPLQSVDGTCDAGTRVMLGRGGGIVQNLSTDRVTLFIGQTGVYLLDVWISRTPTRGPSPAGQR